MYQDELAENVAASDGLSPSFPRPGKLSSSTTAAGAGAGGVGVASRPPVPGPMDNTGTLSRAHAGIGGNDDDDDVYGYGYGSALGTRGGSVGSRGGGLTLRSLDVAGLPHCQAGVAEDNTLSHRHQLLLLLRVMETGTSLLLVV